VSGGRAQVRGEEPRLLPCGDGDVATALDGVGMGEVGVHGLGTTARGAPDLAGERGEADVNAHGRGSLAAAPVGCQK